MFFVLIRLLSDNMHRFPGKPYTEARLPTMDSTKGKKSHYYRIRMDYKDKNKFNVSK